MEFYYRIELEKTIWFDWSEFKTNYDSRQKGNNKKIDKVVSDIIEKNSKCNS